MSDENIKLTKKTLMDMLSATWVIVLATNLLLASNPIQGRNQIGTKLLHEVFRNILISE